MTAVRIRPARPDDRDVVLGLAPQLTAFGEVAGRDASAMVDRDRAVLAAALEAADPDGAVFVAEDAEGSVAGFLHLTTAMDYYSSTVTAHIADVVVAPGRRRRGVGTALIDFAEARARDRGFAMLTLNVFLGNRRARELYARLGFREEWIRCIKRL